MRRSGTSGDQIVVTPSIMYDSTVTALRFRIKLPRLPQINAI